MGQAWCRERTSKAQDSKSPLNRVFVRCAHRIYPSLKEEGSVLGGATQRVTNSEIGYAGSPPRELLARGRSIDSVDRPFHPSDWIDVNLEVPNPPRTSTALTNLTVNTSLYPLNTTTPTSSSNVKLKDTAPVPPPRQRKRNRSRPLPLKPDEIPESVTTNLRRGHTNEEPLYLSVKSPKTSSDEKDSNTESLGTGKICMQEPKHEKRQMKEMYEHKVNGTGKIISSDVVSGKRSSVDKKTSRISDPSHHHQKVFKNEEYERFAGSESIKDSSTPNRQNRRKLKEPEKRIKDSSRDDDRLEANTRTKNYSTVSLPNYDELDLSRHPAQSTKNEKDTGEKMKPKRPVRSSTVSLPAESFLSPFSEKTSVLLEDYIPRRGSVEHLSPYQVLGRLGYSENEVTDGGFMKYDPSKLEDWDLGDISNCELNRCLSSTEKLSCIAIEKDDLVEKQLSKDADVVDSSQNTTSEETEVIEVAVPYVHLNSSASLQKPKSFGKASSSMFESDKESEYSNNWIVDQNRSLRYFDPPTMSEVSKVSQACDLTTSSINREPFFLNEELPRSSLDTIEGSCRNGDVVRREFDRSDQSRLIFDHSLSNESEPYDDSYESKELLRAHSDITNKLIRTISEESLPQEMLEDVDDDEEIVDFFDEKLTKDATNKLKKDCPDQRISPSSPEPKIKAQILDNDHSTLLKVLNDETAEGSNLSSMTPSLTELEATLSDMLEKEDQLDEVIKRENKDRHPEQATVSLTEKLIEPEIVPVKKHNAIDRTVTDQHSSARSNVLVDKTAEHKTDQLSVSLEEILGDSEPTTKTRKVSFCAWEEISMIEPQVSDDINEATCSDSKSPTIKSMLEQDSDLHENFEDVKINVKDSTGFIEESFEKSIKSSEILQNVMEHLVELPTPPRRKNKSISVTQELIKTTESHPKDSDPSPNDRLI